MTDDYLAAVVIQVNKNTSRSEGILEVQAHPVAFKNTCACRNHEQVHGKSYAGLFLLTADCCGRVAPLTL